MNSRKFIYQLSLTLCILVATATSVFAINTNSANPNSQNNLALTEIKQTPNTSEDALQNEKQYIKDIEISGTNIVKPNYILDKMMLHRGDVYNRDLLKTDLTRIYQMGFFTDKMKAVPIENPDHTITLKIIVEENIPITDFTVEGNTVVSTEEILSYLLPLRGQPQNVIQINEAIEGIQNCYAQKGYVLARVSVFDDDPDGVVNLKMSEGVINKIMISGNEKTKDYVVERNILTEPGMVYNENLIKADLVRLYATQAYKDVNRDIEQSYDDPEKYDVTITVQEARTATLSVGGGLDSSTGFFGSVGITDNNFRGRNQRVGLNFLAGSGLILNDSSIIRHANLQAELSFFEPYFLNADTSLMGKVFFRDFGSYQVPLALEQRFGGEVTIAHRNKTNPHLTGTFTLGLENINMREGDRREIERMYQSHYVPISRRAEQLEGGLFLSLAPGLVYDTRDTLVNPRHGVFANLKFEENVAMNDFEKTHGKLTGAIKRYFPVMSKSAFSLTAKAGGVIHGQDKMPEVMAYRLGGPYTVRGYKMSGVGTGSSFVMGSAELTTPFLFLDRIKKVPFFDNIKLAFFVDAGKVFDPTLSTYLYDRPSYAISAGVGVKVFIPGLGPLSIDYGIPLTNPMGGSNKGGYFTFGVGDMLY